MTGVRVGVFDENEVFRRGLAACLTDDVGVELMMAAPAPPADGAPGLDVAVVSAAAAGTGLVRCPLVVCSDADERLDSLASSAGVAAVLPRRCLEVPQLLGAVRAVASGLRISSGSAPSRLLDERSVRVLNLLAEGASTADISRDLGYSVRTIKSVIADAMGALRASTRAEAVATAVRLQLI